MNVFSKRTADDRGFSLIELLVVILIIGVLAAIAIPSFLGQNVMGQDADAKSNVRNLTTQIEACYTQQQNYDVCVPGGVSFPSKTNLPIGGADGQVTATSLGAAVGYNVIAQSKSPNDFTLNKNAEVIIRTCNAPTNNKGGCKTANEATTAGNW